MRKFIIKSFLLGVCAVGLCLLFYGRVHADEKYASLTVGFPFKITHANVCKTANSAILVADMVAEVGTEKTWAHPTVKAFFESGECYVLGTPENPVEALILSVKYHVPIDDGDAVLKVSVVTLKWPPEPADNIYLLGTTPIIGSGIVEPVGAQM